MHRLGALDDLQITKYLKRYKQFKGVYICTQLPKNPKNGCYIINITENVNGHGLGLEEGTHWTTAIIEPKIIYYIDPYGTIPNSYIQAWFNSMNKPVCYSPYDLQGLLKMSCGYFAMYFVEQYCKGRSVNDILNDFSKKVETNEKLLQTYYR